VTVLRQESDLEVRGGEADGITQLPITPFSEGLSINSGWPQSRSGLVQQRA